MSNSDPITISSELEKYNVALEHAPEFAAKVGVIVSLFALVESYVPLLFSKLTKADGRDSFAITGSYASFSYRIDLLDSLLEHRSVADTPDFSTYKHFTKTLREANRIRNKFAHSTYSIGAEIGNTKERRMFLRAFSYDARKKKETEEYDLKKIEADVHCLKKIICELHAYCHRNEPLPSWR